MQTHYRQTLTRFAGAALALILALGSARPASATCLLCSCTVATTSVNFGTYLLTTPTPTTTTSSVSFTCTSALTLSGSITISLSSGSGTFAVRTLRNSSNSLRYNLYLDPALSTIFGDGTSGTSIYNSGTFNLLLSTFTGSATVYGAIPAAQGVPAGPYSDTVTETISF